MSARKKLIEAGWLQYAEHVLPTGAPPVQVQESRRAFYAGAAHLFAAVTEAVGPDSVSEDDGLAVFDGVDAEIREHVELVKRGRR